MTSKIGILFSLRAINISDCTHSFPAISPHDFPNAASFFPDMWPLFRAVSTIHLWPRHVIGILCSICLNIQGCSLRRCVQIQRGLLFRSYTFFRRGVPCGTINRSCTSFSFPSACNCLAITPYELTLSKNHSK